jgi:hypothetical protein
VLEEERRVKLGGEKEEKDIKKRRHTESLLLKEIEKGRKKKNSQSDLFFAYIIYLYINKKQILSN